ncbi:hypothetical protein DB41_HB00010 [Neochlamydia sp. TUME1]|nr:hypothetical protein DB41_HB00010 [Neochlamydia sp. TUME1]
MGVGKRLESLKNNRSRMKRELHARVCGSLRGRFPWATRCLEDAHLTYPDRIEKLIFALSIAFCWAYKLGNIAANVFPISIKNA